MERKNGCLKYLKNKENIKEEELPAKPAAPLNMPADAFPEYPQAFVFSCVFSARPALTKKYEKNVKKTSKKFFILHINLDGKNHLLNRKP